MTAVLKEVSHGDGHAYLPWSLLSKKALSLLSANGQCFVLTLKALSFTIVPCAEEQVDPEIYQE